MDTTPGRENLFSRGPTPPPQQTQFQPSQASEQHVSNPSSLREPGHSATSTLESILNNISAPALPPAIPQPPAPVSNVYAGPQDAPHSGPATPASMNAPSVSSAHSAPSNASTDRQNALLSLLGAVTSPTTSVQTMPLMGPAPPQQVPTPPGSAPRAGPSSNESQGKLLLEQLMSGTAKYTSEQSSSAYPLPGSGGPSPTHLPPLSDTQSHQQGEYYGDASSYTSYEPAQVNEASQPQASAQRPPSPTRRSMFEFVSPFDALNQPTSQQPKRKPIPPQSSSQTTSGEDTTSWTQVSLDPKRKSVENLMDQLTRGQAPLPPPVQSVTTQFETYAPSEEATPQSEFASTRPPRPLPPHPAQLGPNSSPRASPPKPSTQQQPQQQRQQARRSVDSPVGPPGNQNQFQNFPRDKEGSPLPTGFRHPAIEPRAKGAAPKGKNSPNIAQQQTIIFDVSRPLDEIQAPHDSVKSTAIALVKVDSTFLPGTTIGATHWVAYAMTKGRVRVISRSSGDRTLLQLPPLFPSSVSVSDMSVHGDRLAGVTSDGGFVVWELPNVIRDDVLGQIVLCVLPSQDMHPLHAVKWHPQQPDLVAVASESNLYLINIADAHHIFNGEPIAQSELHRVGQIFSAQSPIVAFDFDVRRGSIATISEDSTLTMWRITDKVPFWNNKIRGDDLPSSLTFVDGGLVIGRKNGTIFQLLPAMSRTVLSTIMFVNDAVEDPNMFGHANYDSRIQTLWIANNRRESMIAFKLNFDVSTPSPGGDEMRNAYFDQVVEFVGPKPTIHFVILTADADPTGAEAHAACVAAKVPAGELALVAFSVHSTGVDQVLIRKEWYESAFNSTASKYPLYQSPSSSQPPETRMMRQMQPLIPPVSQLMPPPTAGPMQAQRTKTPPVEDAEGTDSRDEGRIPESKGKGKGRNAQWKNNDEGGSTKEKEKDIKGKGVDTGVSNDALGVTLTKEIRKVEENIHTRIGRLIGKELDKQHQRLEEARANEQAADFVRQEKILKLISTELTKNTTRVVEMAVKAEVTNSVLPALENITRTEVKAALNNQISKGLSESMKQNLPNEIERLLLRPDVSSHIARTFSSAVTPLVERQVKETITKSLIPAYTQQSSNMHQELSREIHSEILNLKKEVITWQSEALRGQETLIREMEQSVRLLSEQVKYLTMNVGPASSSHPIPTRSSPVSALSSHQTQGISQLLRHQNIPPVTQQQPYPQQHGPFQQPPQQQQQPTGPMHGPWFGPNIAAPQASHPAAPPPVPTQPNLPRTPPMAPQTEEWDDTYLAVLGSLDTRQLRELLGRSNPEVVMPLNGSGPLSQAVVLTLVHRLSAIVGETPPADESFKSYLWWLQRASAVLNTSDPLISPYVARVMPNVQSMLNTTKQRLAILPGSPLMDTARMISEVQDVLSRKPM